MCDQACFISNLSAVIAVMHVYGDVAPLRVVPSSSRGAKQTRQSILMS